MRLQLTLVFWESDMSDALSKLFLLNFKAAQGSYVLAYFEKLMYQNPLHA